MKGLMIAALAAWLSCAPAQAGLFMRDWKDLDPETVIRHFERVSFLPYKGTPVLTRVEPDEEVLWTNSGIPIGVVQNRLDELSEVTGLRFRHVSHRLQAAFLIGVAPVELIEQVKEQMGDTPDNMHGKICDALIRHVNGLIFQGVIGIIENLSDEDFHTCLIVEPAQAMGLTRDLYVDFDTVTKEGHFTLSRLPEVDKLMLRVLYDPRLKAGMTREEAMPIVRRILPEYWAKYGPPN